MILLLQEAIIETLKAIPGVASVKAYAGELSKSQGALILAPAILILLRSVKTLPNPGTGEVYVSTEWEALVCTRNAQGPLVRGGSAWDLVEEILILLFLQQWGLSKVSPVESIHCTPIWLLESEGLSVRRIVWSQQLRLGESMWDGEGVVPTEVRLGIDPFIGPDHLADYVEVEALEEGSVA